MWKSIKKSFIALLISFLAFPAIALSSCQTAMRHSNVPPKYEENLENNTTGNKEPPKQMEENTILSDGSDSSNTSSDSNGQTPADIWDLTNVDISDIDPVRKLVAFTFDDAPTRRLESLFAVFAAFNEANPDCKATATIFFNGMLFDNENTQLLHHAVAMGFELGNHTYSHYDLTTLSDKALLREIQQTDEILSRADGKTYHLLRAPFGRINEQVKQFAFTPIIDWTIDTVDWSGASKEQICSVVEKDCYNGSIVLFHDGYEPTIEAMKVLLPTLKNKGYQVVSVSQLAKAHNCVLKRGKVYIRARRQKK